MSERYPSPVQALEALMNDLRTAPKARACIVTMTRTAAYSIRDEFTEKFRSDLQSFDRTRLEARLHNGATIQFRSLNEPRAFCGPEYSHVLKILTPQIVQLLDSMANLSLALRLTPAKEITAVDSR